MAAYEREDYATALKFWRPLAEQGHAEAQRNLGLMYESGQDVPQDDAEAVKWYRKAAEQGHAEAQFNLGLMYENGEGVPQDYAEAAKWYRMAAEQSSDRFRLAQYRLVLKWYRKAAEQGHAEAQTNLGSKYKNGQGVPQDFVRAYFWFSLAAAQDDEEAQEKLDIVAKLMTPDQIAEAQRMAREWIAKH